MRRAAQSDDSDAAQEYKRRGPRQNQIAAKLYAEHFEIWAAEASASRASPLARAAAICAQLSQSRPKGYNALTSLPSSAETLDGRDRRTGARASVSSASAMSACRWRSRWRAPDLPVTGFDIDPAKIAAIDAGRSYIDGGAGRGTDRPKAQAGAVPVDHRFFGGLAACDVIVICVPTPLTRQREPDLSYVDAHRARRSRRGCGRGQLVVLESTTYPGTTDEVLRPILERGRPASRARFLPRLLARARGSRQPRFRHGDDPQGRRRRRRRGRRSR